MKYLYLHVRCCGGGRIDGDINPITSKDGNVGNRVASTGNPLPPNFVPVGKGTSVMAVVGLRNKGESDILDNSRRVIDLLTTIVSVFSLYLGQPQEVRASQAKHSSN